MDEEDQRPPKRQKLRPPIRLALTVHVLPYKSAREPLGEPSTAVIEAEDAMDFIQKVYKAYSKIKGVIVNGGVEGHPNGTIDPKKFQGLFFLSINSQTKGVCSWNTQNCVRSLQDKKSSLTTMEESERNVIFFSGSTFLEESLKLCTTNWTQLRTKQGMDLNLIIFWINVLLDWRIVSSRVLQETP